jgi:mannose-6-phosphate isomerase-like protein (cupin superfamily)
MHAGRTTFFLGALAGAALTAVAAARPLSQAPDAPPRYTSKVVFENDRVRVKDVTFPPGVMDTGMHRHDLPHVGVILTHGALVFTEPGKATETVKFDAGAAGYREANVTHQVANPGKTAMRVIEVELK